MDKCPYFDKCSAIKGQIKERMYCKGENKAWLSCPDYLYLRNTNPLNEEIKRLKKEIEELKEEIQNLEGELQVKSGDI